MKNPAISVISPEIRCAQDYEFAVQRSMAAPGYAYAADGSGRDLTVAANLTAFSQWSVYPRVLRDVSGGHTRVTLGKQAFPHPILLAPVAFQKLAHPAGEIDTARAARATDSYMVCSTLSSSLLEDVAQAVGPHKWFQLYFQTKRDDTRALLARAEAAGYSAIVVTPDASIQVASSRALEAGFRMPADCVAVNLQTTNAGASIELAADDSRIFQGVMRVVLSWSDLAWLMAETSLPIWVKGVLHPDDGLTPATIPLVAGWLLHF